MFRISVDKEKCIGCGACTMCDNFELGDDAKAVAKQAQVEELGCNQEAKDNCPVEAIIVTEE